MIVPGGSYLWLLMACGLVLYTRRPGSELNPFTVQQAVREAEDTYDGRIKPAKPGPTIQELRPLRSAIGSTGDVYTSRNITASRPEFNIAGAKAAFEPGPGPVKVRGMQLPAM